MRQPPTGAMLRHRLDKDRKGLMMFVYSEDQSGSVYQYYDYKYNVIKYCHSSDWEVISEGR